MATNLFDAAPEVESALTGEQPLFAAAPELPNRLPAGGNLFDAAPVIPDSNPLPDEPGSDWLGVGEEVRGLGNSLARGAVNFAQQQNLNALRRQRDIPGEIAKIDAELKQAEDYLAGRAAHPGIAAKGFVTAGEEADYRRAMQRTLGDASRRKTGLQQDLARLEKSTPNIKREFQSNQEILEAIPYTEAQREFQKKETPWWHFFKNPVELTATTTLESAPAMAQTMAAAPLGPAGVALVAGGSSFGAESSGRVMAAMQEAGVDLKNPDAVIAWLADRAKSDPELAKADLAALGPATFDALSGGIAGRWLKVATGRGTRPLVGALAKESGAQMLAGGAGSIAGSKLAGEAVDWKDVVLEMAAEVAPVEAVSNVAAEHGYSPGQVLQARAENKAFGQASTAAANEATLQATLPVRNGRLTQNRGADVSFEKGNLFESAPLAESPETQPETVATEVQNSRQPAAVATPAPAGASPEQQSQVRAELRALPGAQEDLARPMDRLTTEQTDAGLHEAVPAEDDAPVTKGDLRALVDFFQNGGQNPFAAKPVDAAHKNVQAGGQNTPQSAPPGTTKPTFKAGQQVAVRLSNRSNKEHLARIVQLQPDGSAQVQIEGEKTYRTVRADQFQLTKTDAARAAKAAELASVAPEQQAKTKTDAAEFDRLVEDHAPQLGWAPGEAYDRNTVMQEQGVENARLRAQARQAAAKASGVTMYQDNSIVDRAAALPKLEAYLRQQFPDDNSIAKRRAVEQFGRSEPQAPSTPEQRARAKHDDQALRRIAAQNPGVPELQGLQRAVSVSGAPGPTGRVGGNARGARRISAGELQALRELDRLYGTHTIIVDSQGDTLPFNGYKDGKSKVILLHARAEQPLLVVAGHELSHHIMRTHPGLYSDLYDALIQQISPEQLARFRERLRKRGQDTSERNAYVELIGDFFGDQMARPEFWADLKRREPDLFKRLARIVKQWLDKLIAKLKGAKPAGFESEQYFTDLERARDVVADALVQAGRETQYRAAGIEAGEGGQFSKPAKLDEVAQAAAGELVGHHGSPEGTFQAFNETARGIFFTNKPDMAEGYTYRRGLWRTKGKSPKIYTAKLTMKNPLVIEASGARNNNIPFPGQEYKRTVFGNLPSNAVSVEQAASKAFSQGHDGVIIRDVMDANDTQDKTRSTVYVVKSAQQIKPAAADGQFSKPEGDGFSFDAPESVAEQRERLRVEKLRVDSKKAKDAMQERAGARLISDEDTRTQDMFAAPEHRTTRQTSEGQGSLFDATKQYHVDNPAVQGVASLYGTSPESITQILEKGNQPYQQEFGIVDPLFAGTASQAKPGGTDGGQQPQGSSGTDGGLTPKADSLRTHRAADFQRDFARGPLISSINPDKVSNRTIPEYNVNGQVIATPADFAKTLLAVRSPYNESLKVVILDDNNVVQHSEVLYAGALDGLYADARDLLRLFEKHSTRGRRMMISHNHPSGVVTPSAADISVTDKVQRAAKTAGFEILDHVITNGDEFYSFASHEVLPLDGSPLADWELMPRKALQHTTIDDKTKLAALVKELRQGNNAFAHVIYLNTRAHVTAIERISGTESNFSQRVVRGISREGAMTVLIDFGPTVSAHPAATMVRTINNATGGTSRVVDFAAQNTMSGRMDGYISDAPNKPQSAQESGQMGLFSKPERSEFARIQQEIAQAEAELMEAIRQHMNPPSGMRKADALKAKDEAAAKLHRLLAEQLKLMTDIRQLDAARSPEQTAKLISETVDLLNTIQDEISARNAKAEAIPGDLTKLRQDLQERLAMLKGWTDAQEDESRNSKTQTSPRRDDRYTELESASDPDRNTLPQFLEKLRYGLKHFTSPIPELPLTGPRAATSALFRRGYRLFAVENNRVRKEAQEKVSRVVEPLTKLGRKPADNEAMARYYKLHNALQRAEPGSAQRDAIMAQLRKLEETLNQDPFNLFRKLVLYKDLRWRGTYLKNDQGKPITLPMGLTVDEVGAELRRIYQQIEQHPDGPAITEALRRHYALTDELQKSIIEHGEIIPESLKNPLYFPHHIADNWTGRVDRVRPKTEEDFRKYLIAPKGSPKLIQTDYLKAMLLHTADVLAHNARVDLVQKYWQPYDISEQLKAQHGENWTMPWNIPAGYKLFNPYKKLALRMDYILSREVLADKLGVLFNDGDMRARMGETGKVVKVTPEDLHQALVMGEKIQWVLPEEIADALDGIETRENRANTPSMWDITLTPTRWLHRKWKQAKLFAPWNWVRYEYGNLTTDVIDKVLIGDPGTAKQMARARREIWNAGKGEDSPEFKAAMREGILETITEGEMQNLTRLPEFEAFQTPAERRASKARTVLETSMRGSRFREQVFRYAKFLADVERMRAGELPQFGGAFHGDIEALGQDVDGQRRMLDGEELLYAKAAEISLKTYGDYGSLSVVSQFMRTYLAPFWSWQDVNFRYHANLLRNAADGLAARTMPKSQAARQIGGVPALALSRAACRVGAGLFLFSAMQELWNRWGGGALGLWDDDDDLEDKLSEADRRRSHILLGKDQDGKVRVAYTPGAFADAMEWVGGTNLKRLFMEFATGQITMDVMVRDYAKSLMGDSANKLAQSASPALKAGYEAMSGKATFPDVFDQRTIPESEKFWRMVGTLTDDRVVNTLRGAFDKDYYSQPAGEQLQQIILQVRRRDPEQWAYYEAREDASAWKETKTGKRFEAGSYSAPEAVVLRNFRKAIYRGDVVNAARFYNRLLEYGYTAERLDASIRNQAPLADLNEAERAEYTKTLTPKQKRELDLANQYYNRIKALDGRERQLFPKKGQQPRPNPELLKRIVSEQKK